MEKDSHSTGQVHRQWLVTCLAVLLTGAFAGWHLASWPVRLSYPGEQNLSEGMPLTEVLHFRQGLRIYDPASPTRFDAANYGPLYYLLGAQLIDLQRPAYLPLRLVSLLGILGCAGGCALLAFWLTRSYLVAALAPLVFLSYAFVHNYGTSARSDTMALGLSFGGFLVAYRLQDSKALLLSTLPMLLALFYKQQFVAFPLAVLVFLVLERRYRLVIEFAGLLVGGGLGLLALFQFAIFRDQAFLDHFLLYNALPLSLHSFSLGGSFFLLVLLVPLLVGLEFLRSYPDKMLACGLGCSVFLNLMAVGREGSDTNYFLECVLILSTLFAALIAKRVAEPPRAAELLILLVISLFTGQWFATPPPQQSDFVLDRAVQDYLKRNFAPQTPALGYYSGDLARAGLQTPISNIYHYTSLVRKGVISDRDLPTQVESRRFGIVVLNFDLQTERGYWANYYLTERVRLAILANYQLAISLEMPQPEKFRADDHFYAWVPRP